MTTKHMKAIVVCGVVAGLILTANIVGSMHPGAAVRGSSLQGSAIVGHSSASSRSRKGTSGSAKANAKHREGKRSSSSL